MNETAKPQCAPLSGVAEALRRAALRARELAQQTHTPVVVYRNGKVVGVTTSGAFGHATAKSLAFAYVPPDATAEGTEFEIMVFGEMRKARIIPESIWDPDNARIRA